MATRYFALGLGIVYTLVGLLGFIPGLLEPPAATAPDVAVDTLYGRLLGLFPVNILHTLVHLAVGILGIVAYASFSAARKYARGVGILFAILAVMGLLPVLETTFGLIPLFGNDIWLHALTALAGLYFGYVVAEERIPTAQR